MARALVMAGRGGDPRWIWWLGCLGIVLVGGAACGSAEQGETASGGEDAGAPVVYVVNYPLQYFAERVGGGVVEVEFPAPSDVDPAFWQPGPAEIAAFQGADLILLNGATYAKWIDRVTLPESRLIFTADGFDDEWIRIAGAVTHTHGPEGEHSHQGIAFTTWLDPALAIAHAEAIHGAFVVEWPQHAATFTAGLEALRTDLLALDGELERVTSTQPSRPLLASHPVYQYLGRRYELDIRSVQWEPDEPPTEQMWRELGGMLRERPAQWMLWESEPSPETAARLRSLGVEPVVFRTLGSVPGSGDYLDGMRENVGRLEGVFSDR